MSFNPEWIIGQGVAIGVLMWFMLRMEKRMEDVTKEIQKLVTQVENLCGQVRSQNECEKLEKTEI